jgi:hypothetical protein
LCYVEALKDIDGGLAVSHKSFNVKQGLDLYYGVLGMVSRLGYCILVARDSIQRTRLWLSRGGNFNTLPKISLYLIYLFLLYCDLYCAYQAACTLPRVN